MSDYLVISAMFDDKPGVVEQLSGIIATHQANVSDSRMTVLGKTFAVIMLVNAEPQVLDELEVELTVFSQTNNFILNAKRTQYHPDENQGEAYKVEAITVDSPGIVYALSQFFGQRGINILNLVSTMQPAAHSGLPMFAIDMIVDIPASHNINELKEDFMVLCDNKNLDASLERLSENQSEN
jgi:glycine cleavage system transcriptional repressor